MGAGGIELPIPITRSTVERAYGTCSRAQQHGSDYYVTRGRRAAKARDPKLLLVLQKGAEILQKMSEEQAGAHGFDVGGIRVQHTEFTMWKNAYLAVDSGDSEKQAEYSHFYGMGALLAGLCE
jgi:hypothetical protein